VESLTLFGFAITYAFIWKAIRIVLYVVIGFPLLTLVTRAAMRALGNYGTQHVRMLLSKVIYYSGFLLLLISVLNELGFQLSALLGAAGIFGVAIGFASQTSMSNLISGLFLISEGFLSVGDLIECSGVHGVVETIDLFSVKIRTFDDNLVRIPNERLIKNDLTNITYYPYRRAEIGIAVAATTTLEQLKSVLDHVVEVNELAVKNPAPDVIFKSISSSALHVTLRVWTPNKTFLALKQSLLPEIREQLIKKDIKPLYVIVH
jgi:small-conductance mechanosensitive channel